jgi:hypothetical protein
VFICVNPWLKSAVVALAAMVVASVTSAAPQSKLDRWFYCSTNLATDKNVADLDRLFHRAARGGYNGVVLNDSKFARLAEMDPHYFANVDRVKQIAHDTDIRVVPTLFPIGYSNSLLAHDPNLAESLPVRDVPLVVNGGIARVVADPQTRFDPSDFATLDRWRVHDPNVIAEQDGAIRITDPRGEHGRVMQSVRVSPFRQYHISVEAKTESFRGTAEIKVLGAGGRELNYASLGVVLSQDWHAYHVVFNSLENDHVDIYFGSWDGKTGSLRWRNPRIEETAFVNLVRRDGAPLRIVKEDGAELIERRDFESLVDPRMGTVPRSGGYEVWHQPPALRIIGLTDGTRLRASFYHPAIFRNGQVTICPSEPATVDLLRDQARRLHHAWGANGYFMSHDEIRALNRDDACARRKLDAGEILADNARTCVNILREVNPGGDIYVWSDMFDPNHNARSDYYLVRGDLRGSWLGLDKDVIVVPWYFEKRRESLRWFAGRGHRMLIAGYYDRNPARVRDWLDAARDVPSVTGIMYTTWHDEYKDLERFAHLLATSAPER